MKRVTFYLTGIILGMLFNSKNLTGQNPICGNTEHNHSKQTDIIDCSKSSDTWINIYKKKEHYKPDIDVPIKTLHVNINIWQRYDGTGNLSDIPMHISRLKQIMIWVNNKYKNVNPNAIPALSYSVESYTDSKIRIVLDSIYFYHEPSLHRSTSDLQLLNHLRSLYPERLNEFNIFFTEPLNIGQTSGYTNYLPSLNNFDLDQCIFLALFSKTFLKNRVTEIYSYTKSKKL